MIRNITAFFGSENSRIMGRYHYVFYNYNKDTLTKVTSTYKQPYTTPLFKLNNNQSIQFINYLNKDNIIVII